MRTDLYLADELFFTGTAAEITPIRSVDDHEVGAGPITKADPEGVLRRSPRAARRSRPSTSTTRTPAAASRGVVTRRATRSASRSRGRTSARARRSSCSRRCAPACSGSARWPRASRRLFAAFSATRYAAAVSSGTAGLHLAVRLAGHRPGRRGGRPAPITLRRVGQRGAVRARHARLRRRRRPHLQPRPGRGRGGHHAAHEGHHAGAHLRLPVPTWSAINAIAERHGLAVIEDAAEAVGARRAGRRVGSHGNPAVFAFYPNKQMTTGEGGMVTTDDEATYARLRSLSNQGRSDTGDWLEHDRLGFNYRLDELSAARRRRRRSSASTRSWPPAPPSRRATTSCSPASTASTLPAATSTGDERSWFVYVVRLDAGDRPQRRDGGACRSAASPASRTCRRSTCSRSTARSATARASARSPRRSPAARSRCRSTRGSPARTRSTSPRRSPTWSPRLAP